MLHWWTAQPDRLSKVAVRALTSADEHALASISWYELAWLAQRGRIALTVPVRTWLERLAGQVRTVSTSPAIAVTAAELASSIPGDPADRIIYATAIEHGWQVITKDERLLSHPYPRKIAVW